MFHPFGHDHAVTFTSLCFYKRIFVTFKFDSDYLEVYTYLLLLCYLSSSMNFGS